MRNRKKLKKIFCREKTVVKISALWYNSNVDDACIAKSATKASRARVAYMEA